VTIKDLPAFSSLNNHSHCLLCGSLNPRSLNLSFQLLEKGVVRTEFKGHEDLQGYDDILHGGVIAALLDAAMTHCLFHHGIQAVTGDLHVRFLTPISCSAKVEVLAWMLSRHPPLYRLRAEIKKDDILMAWGEAKFVQNRVTSSS
jgi:acyl-coenzyme A thioesterase PaaI-like protein